MKQCFVNNPREIIIAIDAMGGDLGPIAVIKGAFQASKKIPKIKRHPEKRGGARFATKKSVEF